MTFIPASTSGSTFFADSPNLDAFGRVRSSNPATLFNNKQLFDKQPLYWAEKITNNSGSVSSVHSSLKAATTMTLGTSSGDRVIRRTKRVFNYQPGKSQQIMMTFRMGNAVANCTKRVGFFNDSDGLFLEQDGTNGINLVIRSNVTGTPVETKIPQASWNVDKFDGTGNSGITLDLSKTQIFFIDFEWLGVGRVRFGFVIGGIVYYVHYENNSNILETVYMSNPNLPLTYEIVNTGATASQPSMDHICTAVFSEGGFNPVGETYAYSMTVPRPLGSSNRRHVFSFRQAANRKNKFIKIEEIEILTTTSANMRWFLILNPSGLPVSYTQFGTTGIEYNDTLDAGVTGGLVLESGYISNNTDFSLIKYDNNIAPGFDIDGVPDTFVIAAQTVFPGSESTYVTLRWREL